MGSWKALHKRLSMVPEWLYPSRKSEYMQTTRLLSTDCRLTIPLPSVETSRSLLMGGNLILEQQLDQLGEELISAITQAATASIPSSRQGPRSKPWWNADFLSLRQSMLHCQCTFQQELAMTSSAEAFFF
jgi:hypothetical protein